MVRLLALALVAILSSGCFSFEEARKTYCGRKPGAPGCAPEPDAGSPDAGESDAGHPGDGGVGPCAPELEACGPTELCTVVEDEAVCSCPPDTVPDGNGDCAACPSGQAIENGGCADAFTQMETNFFGTCGIRTDGTLWCWGSELLVAEEDGTLEQVFGMPRLVKGGQWKDVSIGHHHACAVDASDALWCWGQSWRGEVGHGVGTDVLLPTKVTFPMSVRIQDVEVGETHSCALTTEGHLYCWGANDEGQSGVPIAEGTAIGQPTRVGTSSGWARIALGRFHTCGIDGAAVYCFGDNGAGQLGNPDTATKFAAPTPLDHGATPNTGWTAITAGRNHTCGIREGEVFCWGNDTELQLGIRGLAQGHSAEPLPLELEGGATWTSVSAGDAHTCAVGSTGARCWGRAELGQLGHGRTTFDSTRHVTPDVEAPEEIVAGGQTTCATRTSGTAVCWGSGAEGQLGTNRLHVTRVRNPSLVVDEAGSLVNPVNGQAPDEESLFTTEGATCALDASGPRCWGANAGGRFGTDFESRSRPGATASTFAALEFTKVVLGRAHGCGITGPGEIYCWGQNEQGQLGQDDSVDESSEPLLVSAGVSFLDVCSGAEHVCAMTMSPSVPTAPIGVKCWGGDGHGQLGNGSGASVPGVHDKVNLGPSDDVVGLACGAHHTCVLVRSPTTASTRVSCWGRNDLGQVDQALPSEVPSPAEVAVLGNGASSDFRLFANFDTTWVVETRPLSVGDATCWGSNAYGACEPAKPEGTLPPPASWPPGRFQNVLEASPGHTHSCVLFQGGTASCFGWNQDFQLGNGNTNSNSHSPPGVWRDISAGYHHTCGVSDSDGALYCWGNGVSGELGNNDAFSTTPISISLE